MSDPSPERALDDVLDRVRKLLALATSPNVHEAAAAAARAQALISRYRLEARLDALARVEADPDPITDGRDEPLELSRKARKWKVALAGAIAEANGCVPWVWDRGDGQAICLVGRSRDRAVARALWDALIKRIEWLSATAKPNADRHWHEAFRIGAADAVADRLAAGEAEARAQVEESALARVDLDAAAHQEALDRFVEQQFGPGRGRAMRVDARAWAAGRAAGAAMPLKGPRG